MDEEGYAAGSMAVREVRRDEDCDHGKEVGRCRQDLGCQWGEGHVGENCWKEDGDARERDVDCEEYGGD